MATKYDYTTVLNIDDADDVNTALWFTIVNYMHHQLGWEIEDCKLRFNQELKRIIPSGIFDHLEKVYEWNINGARLLDVGAGQGGTVLEALKRDAKAWGIEPGEEFCRIGQMRLAEDDYQSSRIMQEGGENIPFPDNHFDYVISLQVMEHVNDPELVMQEINRVLKPGGECYIACENYLSFMEQHYRVPWLPLLPKPLGRKYLNWLGREPHFLQNYVYYTTYLQIWRLSKKMGFKNRTYTALIHHHLNKASSSKKTSQFIIKCMNQLPASFRDTILQALAHARYVFAVGVSVVLKKN